MTENFIYLIGRSIIPKRLRPGLRLYLLKTGVSEVPYTMFGMLFLISGVMSYLLFMAFIYRELRAYGTFQTGLLSFISFAVIMSGIVFTISVVIYFYWNIKVYNRTKELEEILPDYLTLVSTNLKGGMSFENALWNAIKPEFGILASEIGLVSKRVMTGNDVQEALLEFSMKYESPTLRRTIQLLVGEIESGGRIVDTIDRVIYDMKKTQSLKREMAASTVTYMIFIGMLVVFIMPVLFALSLQLFTITSGFITNVASTVSSGPGGLSFSSPSIGRDDFRIFSIAAITIISVFSSIILSIIEKGDYQSGLKYIPMFLISSVTIYLISVGIFSYVFGGITFG